MLFQLEVALVPLVLLHEDLVVGPRVLHYTLLRGFAVHYVECFTGVA